MLAAVITLEEPLSRARCADVLAIPALLCPAMVAVLTSSCSPTVLAKTLMMLIRHLADAHHLTAARAVQRMVVVTRAVLTLCTEDTD